MMMTSLWDFYQTYVLINNVMWLVVATSEFFFSREKPAKYHIHFQALFKQQQRIRQEELERGQVPRRSNLLKSERAEDNILG